MTDEDLAVTREADGKPTSRSRSRASPTTCCLVESESDAYDRFYNVIANPMLWFIQHYLWDLSNAPDIRQQEADAWDYGYQRRQRGHRRAPCSRRSRPTRTTRS